MTQWSLANTEVFKLARWITNSQKLGVKNVTLASVIYMLFSLHEHKQALHSARIITIDQRPSAWTCYFPPEYIAGKNTKGLTPLPHHHTAHIHIFFIITIFFLKRVISHRKLKATNAHGAKVVSELLYFVAINTAYVVSGSSSSISNQHTITQ